MSFLKNEKGNVTVLVTVIMLALLGSVALVLDIGVVYAEKVQLVNALDAALLAGGQELPDNKVKARAMMEQYLVANEVDVENANITISADGMSASISGERDVDHIFAKVIGFDTTRINETSNLILGAASSASGGLRPFAVEKFPYNYGDSVVLKNGAGDGYHGNYGAVALGANGASVLLYNALYGYDGQIEVGDLIDTEPGNMASVVNQLRCYFNSIENDFENHENNSERLWTIPLVDTLLVSGRKEVQVVGFAQVYVDEVRKVKGKAEIHGRFVQFVTSGDIDQSVEDTGVYGMKLVD